MSYGYGLSTSLFQLARAYTVFARDGEVMPVSLLRQTEAGRRPARDLARDRARRARHAAAGRRPRRHRAAAQAVGYSVGGKTGTAHKQEGKGYANRKYRAWFVGMAPISKPRIVVAVMVDEPSNGRVLRRRRGRAGVQPGGAADAAHDGRAARPRGQTAGRGQEPCPPWRKSF
jgi:cell division protein FtsI (penicillin-binding protein 3)